MSQTYSPLRAAKRATRSHNGHDRGFLQKMASSSLFLIYRITDYRAKPLGAARVAWTRHCVRLWIGCRGPRIISNRKANTVRMGSVRFLVADYSKPWRFLSQPEPHP